VDGIFHAKKSVEQDLEWLLVKGAFLLALLVGSGRCRRITIGLSCIVALVEQSWVHARN